jgi:hypothetical protein
MRRHRLSVRAVTSVGHKLPVDWEEKMASFKLFVENAKSGVELEHIGNMDEVPVSWIPVSFDITSNYTVDEKGSQDIRISTTGNEMFNIWLQDVWRKRKNSLFTSNSLLIYDSTRFHFTDQVKSVVKKYSKIAVIPAGLTKKLQPLDLSVNKSFKSKMRTK